MMKKLLLLAFILASLQLTAQQMLVGSYNIRYKNWNDSVQGEHWQKRCQVICDQVNFMSPDIFGTQEVLWEQTMASGAASTRLSSTKRTNSNSSTTAIFGSAKRQKSPAWAGMRPASASALGASSAQRFST